MAKCQGHNSPSISVASFDEGDTDRIAKWKREDAPLCCAVKSLGNFVEKDVGKSLNI